MEMVGGSFRNVQMRVSYLGAKSMDTVACTVVGIFSLTNAVEY